MSFALALRNPEGVLLAADTGSWEVDSSGRRRWVLKDKIRWVRSQRAACALFPVWAEMSMLVDTPDEIGELDPSADIRASTQAVHDEVLPLHLAYMKTRPDAHTDWKTPQLAVVAYPESGPRLLRVTDGTIEERAPVDGFDFEFLGAWNELGPCDERVFSAPWRRADNIARAKRMIGDLMTAYVADYEQSRVWERTGRRIGGHVRIATITKRRIDLETYRGKS